MITGLIQVTVLAWWVLSTVKNVPSIAYLGWIFLIASAEQYPGMLGVFGGLLSNFQHYSKGNLMSFLKSTLFDTFSQIFGALIGRWYGLQNPAIGEMFGMALGYVVGEYLSQFVGLGIGLYLMNDIFTKMGFSWKVCFDSNIPWDVAKESLTFGLKTMSGVLYGTVLGFFGFLITFDALPQYASWMGLINIANGVVRLVGIAEPLGGHVSDGLAESYHNKKMGLTRYLLATSMKWEVTVDMFMGGFILVVVPLALVQLIGVIDLGDNWEGIVKLIPFMTLLKMTSIFDDNVSFTSLGFVNTDQIMGMVSGTLNFFVQLFMIYVVKKFDIWIFLSYGLPVGILMKIFRWWFINKKIFKVQPKDFIGQLLVPTFLAWGVYMLVLLAYIQWVFPAFINLLALAIPKTIAGFAVAIISALAGLTVFPMMFFAIYAYFGGFDDASLQVLEFAVPLSGPSKAITNAFYKSSVFMHKRSPFANKFILKDPILARKEADELLILKRLRAARKFIELGTMPESVEQ
jgi:hypothetical protein